MAIAPIGTNLMNNQQGLNNLAGPQNEQQLAQLLLTLLAKQQAQQKAQGAQAKPQQKQGGGGDQGAQQAMKGIQDMLKTVMGAAGKGGGAGKAGGQQANAGQQPGGNQGPGGQKMNDGARDANGAAKQQLAQDVRNGVKPEEAAAHYNATNPNNPVQPANGSFKDAHGEVVVDNKGQVNPTANNAGTPTTPQTPDPNGVPGTPATPTVPGSATRSMAGDVQDSQTPFTTASATPPGGGTDLTGGTGGTDLSSAGIGGGDMGFSMEG